VNQEEAFIEDIAEHPDDDAPRLVFADWLEDHGDSSRAEFIRVQCRLARLDEDAPEREELERREKELLKENEIRWLGAKRFKRWQFRRGMLEYVVLSAQDFPRKAARLFRAYPIRHIKFHSCVAVGEGSLVHVVSDCPQLARISRLDVRRDELR
jgi:uncharacterized protein (TIGR02996 family)